MIVYVRLEVGLHGLSAASAEEVAARVARILTEGLDPAYVGDVEVELIESAGTPA